ncbi:DUF882 domain-containing protein [Terrarubrum flagellatum]|uniref:DUF882 domain-containing protein n=1 Tax=Terrirubrum flagellatum TaxID=2895980 RepID=UPI0031452CB8
MQADPAPRASALSRFGRRSLLAVGVFAVAATVTVRGTPYAIAQGETRTLTFIHNHTKESATITFKRWGSYDYSALEQLNWLARDWRRDEKIRMNPKLFDVLWEAHREAGSSSPIYINSAYRSPETNSMLRRRSRAVAKHSQHMEGNAMDFYLDDVPMSRIREVGMRMQRGGVGYYPNANTVFVHLDVGSVRSWPRMTRDQLARLFPDEMTVHLPAGGGAMARYEEAKAMIIARGGSVGGYSGDEETETFGGGAGFFAALFGGGRGGGGTPAAGGGDDAGMRSIAMGNTKAGESALGAGGNGAVMVASNRSLRGRRGRAVETQVASAEPAPAPAPAPAAAPAPVPVAAPAPQPSPIFSLFGSPSAQPAPAPVQVAVASKPADEPKTKAIPVIAQLPMPPLRPAEFSRAAIASLSDIPMPPARPTDLAPAQPVAVAAAEPPKPARADDALGAIIRRSTSPDDAPRAPPQVAAYAPVEMPLPPSRPGGIRSATPVVASAGFAPAGRQESTKVESPTTTAVSEKAPSTSKLALAPVDEILMEFRRKANVGPSAGSFTGPAVKPLAQSLTTR